MTANAASEHALTEHVPADDARTEDILGYRVTTLTAEECAAAAAQRVERGGAPAWFACLNPHAYMVARRDPLFSRALSSADLLVPDGVGVIVAARLLRKHLCGRVTGSDFFLRLMERFSSTGERSVFLLGSTDDNLKTMQERIARDFPRVRIAGALSPPFRDRFSAEESAAMIAAINAAAADCLWVGMTAPKEENWIYEHLSELNVKFAAAIGAVFDYYTGRVRRPHAVFRRMGLEWLVRLLGEPRRLWKRNFVSMPLFLIDVISSVVASHRSFRRRLL